jgi:hypothetical protein
MNYSTSRHLLMCAHADAKHYAKIRQKKVKQPVITSAWFFKQPIR